MIFDVTVNGHDYRVQVEQQEDGTWSCQVNGDQIALDSSQMSAGVLSILVGGESYEVVADSPQQIAIRGNRYSVEVRDPRSWRSRRALAGTETGPKKVVAPMPGKVVRVIAQPGAEIELNGGVIVIEAMKMQNELRSPKKGRVAKVLVAEGAAVNAGDVLAIIE
jgi:biotin carboxyl carrier protein